MSFLFNFIKYGFGLLIGSLGFVLGGFYISNILDPRYTWDELDRNGNGIVGFGEADYVSSSGARLISVNGQECTQYFAYKDGLPLKVVCD